MSHHRVEGRDCVQVHEQQLLLQLQQLSRGDPEMILQSSTINVSFIIIIISDLIHLLYVIVLQACFMRNTSM
jgi:hypothetical protein